MEVIVWKLEKKPPWILRKFVFLLPLHDNPTVPPFHVHALNLYAPSNTIIPEIFARVLFSLNFADGVGPRKLSARNFLRTRKF